VRTFCLRDWFMASSTHRGREKPRPLGETDTVAAEELPESRQAESKALFKSLFVCSHRLAWMNMFDKFSACLPIWDFYGHDNAACGRCCCHWRWSWYFSKPRSMRERKSLIISSFAPYDPGVRAAGQRFQQF